MKRYDKRIRIINGMYRGREGIISGVYWAAGMCSVILDNKDEIYVPIDSVITVDTL